MQRNKDTHDIKAEDYFFHWRRKYGNPKKLKQGVYGNVLKDFHLAVLDRIVNENFVYKLPRGLGKVSARKSKVKMSFNEDGTLNKKNFGIDWGKTKKHWEKTYPGETQEEINQHKDKKFFYHLNQHTDGYVYTFKWYRVKGNPIKNLKIYKFYAATKWKKYLTKRLLEDNSLDFYEK